MCSSSSTASTERLASGPVRRRHSSTIGRGRHARAWSPGAHGAFGANSQDCRSRGPDVAPIMRRHVRRPPPPDARARRRPARRRVARPTVEIVVPVYNEEADLEALDPPAPRATSTERVPAPVADHHRRQRQHRRHVGHRLPRSPHELDGVAGRPPRRKGPRPGAARGVVGQRRRRRRLHGRRPVDRPRRAAAARRAARVRPQRRRHRHPPGRRTPGRARARAGGDLPDLQPAPARRRCAAGSPTPSAGSRRCAPTWPGRLLPMVEDDGWFFDTELLVLAEHNGLRIHEVPVDWVDDPDSRVDVVAHRHRRPAGLWRMLRRCSHAATVCSSGAGRAGSRRSSGRLAARQQLVRFASIGVVSTVVFAAALRPARRPARPGRRRRRSPSASARSPTPPPTAGSRSPCGGGPAGCGTTAAGLAVALLPLVLTLGDPRRARPPPA